MWVYILQFLLYFSQLHFHVKQFWLGNLQLSLYLKIVRKVVRIVKYKIARSKLAIKRKKSALRVYIMQFWENISELQGVNHNCKKKKSELIAQKLQLPFYIFKSVVETSFHRFTSATTQNLMFSFRASKALFMLQLWRSRHFGGLLGHLPPRYRLPVDRHHWCQTWRLHHAGEMIQNIWTVEDGSHSTKLFYTVDSLFRMQFTFTFYI